MRKIILILTACVVGLTGVMAQSVELTPSGYEGKHTTSNNVVIKTNAIPVINMFRHGGSIATPSATPANFTIGRVWGGGHTGADFLEGAARLDFRTTTNVWSMTNTGAFMRFLTTPDGTIVAQEQMRLSDIGNLGIGTADPQVKLHVKGSDVLFEDTTPFLEFRNTGDAGANGIRFANATGSSRGLITYTPGVGLNGTLKLSQGTGANNGIFLTEGFGTIGSSNNIGINEANPAASLHIRANSQPANPHLKFVENNNSLSDNISFENSSSTQSWTIKTQNHNTLTTASKYVLNVSNFGDVVSYSGDGNTKHHGFTQLGNDNDVPKIKMKKLTGTTDADAQTLVAHGLTRDKILAVDIHTSNGLGVNYPPSGNGLQPTNRLYRYYINSVHIILDDVGSELQGQSYWILITYEE